MIVAEYMTHFYSLSRYFYTSITTESEKIQQFVKGLHISIQLAMSQMVVFGTSIQSIMDYAMMTEGIL